MGNPNTLGHLVDVIHNLVVRHPSRIESAREGVRGDITRVLEVLMRVIDISRTDLHIHSPIEQSVFAKAKFQALYLQQQDVERAFFPSDSRPYLRIVR